MAMLLDELSMVPPDVYHAGAFRFAMTRQEHWRLEIVRYLEQWFGKVPIGVQLADFLQLRPTACLSLCEWQDAQRATDAAVVPESDNGVEEAAAERTSNASELGRLAFKSSLQRVVHFTGSGRFSQCASGQQLVKILLSMREGRPLEDGLWEALEARSIGGEQLLENQMLQTRLLNFGVGTRPTELTKEQSLTALQVANMNKTQYLVGICPLFEGMAARISCILDMPMLSRELPVFVRSIKLRPKEPAILPGSGCAVLRYQPLAVLVEVDDPEYRSIQLPDGSAPPGHVWLRAVTSDLGWDLSVGGKQAVQVVRK
ncbi:unnamed protein product, partial [Durusdinium trenchii]